LDSLGWAAVTNEHHARVSTIVNFKAAGLLPGHPDLYIWWIDQDDIQQFRYLEVKTKIGKLSKSQKKFLESRSGKNVDKKCGYGYKECIAILDGWLTK